MVLKPAQHTSSPRSGKKNCVWIFNAVYSNYRLNLLYILNVFVCTSNITKFMIIVRAGGEAVVVLEC